MNSVDTEVLKRIKRHLEEMVSGETEVLIRGAISDFSEYKRRTGRISALIEVSALIDDVVDKVMNSAR